MVYLDPTERLKKYNASATAGDVLREGLSLFHSSFSQDWHLTTFNGGGFDANVRSTSVSFVPHPFKFRKPTDSASGRFDVNIDIFNDGETFMSELLLARSEGASSRIELEYNVYFEAEEDSHITPIVLDVIKVAFALDSATITASRPNIQNKKFPNMIYTPSLFPGLVR